MKRSIGVICECNPFHAGHEHLLSRARASGANVVIAVMSGAFVQRGEPAIAPPHLRAEALLAGGADLVLELPFPYAASGAEFFANAGVDILARLGADELWFGSECGDIRLLENLAALAESEEFAVAYEKTASEARGTAQAYFETLQSMVGQQVPCSPNDILGICYLRAIAKLGARMRAVTIQRQGSAYHDEVITSISFPSATALRQKWREEGVEAILPLLPSAVASVYSKAAAPASLQFAERLILGHFRLTPVEELESAAELFGGLGSRMSQAAQQAASLEDFFALSATKKYPLARLRRGILFALTGITQNQLRTPPAYVRLLAANATGCRFLSNQRKNAAIPVITRRSDLPNTAEARAQESIEARAWALYTLCLPRTKGADRLWQTTPIIKQ